MLTNSFAGQRYSFVRVGVRGGGPDRSVINAGTRGGRQTKIINIYHSRFPRARPIGTQYSLERTR